ncbi:adenylate/guanylate cyclase domain-containing protein [Stappia sp. F7233]|uniref:Adenylate/guanylate cyclase domain-containing protein n=1 Tax=Stappia albiluteola TaxID=2758565 RepID=A0A839AAE8_9HYPH|nr:adenylate/guanylate cyclase domain-containing protein [Stappia albiluteola]MBA5776391.1 adenylate/guanylate cyclase domain-containing protein [Stappia albiluteola]
MVKEIASANERRRSRLSLTALVGAAFGGLVTLAVLIVLFMAVMANRQNTFSLLNDKSILITRSLANQVRENLDSVSQAVIALKRMFDGGQISGSDFDRMKLALNGAILANSVIDVIVYTDLEQNESGIYRSETGKLWPFQRQAGPEIARLYVLPDLGVDSPPTWGPLTEVQGRIYANITVPLVRHDKLVGYLTAAVSTREIGDAVRQMDESDDETVFIINGDDKVIAHSDLNTLRKAESVEGRLPADVKELGDPVLALANGMPTLNSFKEAELAGVDVRRVDLPENGDAFIVMTSKVEGYGPEPWIVGEYFRATSISREISRLRGSLIVGLFAAAISFLLALWMARRVARPLKELSQRAGFVGKLEFDHVRPLERSRVSELDQVALAFNAMVVGLKAMNTYVPRTLFRKLMRIGLGEATQAREADLTIIFTDIAGFTSLSENMTAGETAAILNEHFALLVAAVEAEGGTVDKFIGDGMLAFWGAPDARADHAQAALRSCLRMAEAVHEANRKAKEDGKVPIRLRVGVHSGHAVVGNVGALDRWNYTVVGDAVNVCSRLQELGREVAPDDELVILASADTVRRVPGIEGVEPAGSHHLRGRRMRIDVWRVGYGARGMLDGAAGDEPAVGVA